MYVCNTMIPNIEFIKAIHTEIRTVFWKGGIPKIKENVLICDFKDGGIKMPEISLMIKACRISWIKRFIDKENSLWKKIPEFYQIDQIEKQIAIKNGKYAIHLKKWEILFGALKID